MPAISISTTIAEDERDRERQRAMMAEDERDRERQQRESAESDLQKLREKLRELNIEPDSIS